MKEFLTEWLIRYGTGWVEENSVNTRVNDKLLDGAVDDGFIEDATPQEDAPFTYQLTPKGLAFLKEPE